MSKEHIMGNFALQKLNDGVNKVADLVKVTLGPKGNNVAIDRKFFSPLITNDGVTIAKEFNCKDKYENMGVKLIKEVCQKTNDNAGDGTTTAIVLAQKMLNNGLKQVVNGVSPILINKGINKAKDLCIALLKQKSVEITTPEQVKNIATISCQDEYIGNLILTAYKRLGKNFNIVLQDGKTATTEMVFQDGVSFDKGFISPYLCNDMEKLQTNFEDCFLLITDEKITNFNKLLPIFEQVISESKPILIICDDITDEALSPIIVNKVRGAINCCVVKAPFFADKKQAFLTDLACLTNTTVISQSNNIKWEDVKLNMLGVLKQAKILKDKTTLVSKQSNKEKLNERIQSIKQQIKDCEIDYDKEQLKNRLSNLTGGIATIFVGANSDIEQQEKKLRIEDAISATSSALEEGVIAGGGVALFKTKDAIIKKTKKLPPEEKLGAEIFISILDEPIKQILKNAGLNSEIILNKIKNNKNINYGYDALNNKFVNMLTSGIIDPTKVTTNAVNNAASVVTTMLTTTALITDEEE